MRTASALVMMISLIVTGCSAEGARAPAVAPLTTTSTAPVTTLPPVSEPPTTVTTTTTTLRQAPPIVPPPPPPPPEDPPPPSPEDPPPPPLEDPVVFAIGDSVMLGVACTPDRSTCYGGSWNLEQRIDELTSNAQVSRSFAAGDDVLASWLSAGNDPDVVVVHLGTNGGGSSLRFDDIMDEAGSDRRVLFVNIRQKNTSNETAMNDLLAAKVDDYDNAELVDWFSVSAGLGIDAIDPNYGAHLWATSLQQAYVEMVDEAVHSPQVIAPLVKAR